MIAEKKYIKAQSVEDAIAAAMESTGSFTYIAGGTDVVVNKFQGNIQADCLIDITGIDELKHVTTEDNLLRIGALVTLDDLKKHPVIADNFPALLEAAHSVASPLIRKTATIGGNILCENRCSFYNQSEWWREAVGYCLKCDGDICIATGGKNACFSKLVSDTAPLLISCNAQIEIADKHGNSVLNLEDIYSGDGVKPVTLSKTALITSILLPLGKSYKCVFKKLRPRESVDFSSLTTSISLSSEKTIRIVVASVDPKPILVEGKVSDDRESLILKAFKKCRVVDNDIYSREYRREMIKVFLTQSFDELGL